MRCTIWIQSRAYMIGSTPAMIATTVIIFGRKWSTFDYQSSAASSLIWLNFHRIANDSHFTRAMGRAWDLDIDAAVG